jgi:tetratricopeptide (TPR) repeat protein
MSADGGAPPVSGTRTSAPLMDMWTKRDIWILAACLALAMATAPGASGQTPAAQGKIVAVQGRVEHAAAARREAWSPAAMLQPLFVDDRVRTLALSRAAILFLDETQVRLNAGAVLTVQAVKRGTGAPTALDLIQGEGWFRTKNPNSGLTIKTPAATAAIRGTEINVQITPDGESVLTVVEGAAEFANDAGSVLATAGEEARARPGQAPTKRTILNPDNAVQWALYYPVQQARADVAAAAASAQAPGQGQGQGQTAQAQVNATIAQHAEAAATALTQGDAVQARREIGAALALDAQALRPLLLLATLELTLNRVDAAGQAVERARAGHPNSVGALIAASEVAQARFELDEARRLVDRALTIDPDEVRALVNRARLRFGSGDTHGAEDDAARAVRVAPDDAGALSLRGFIELARGRVREASDSFARAIAADREFGEPHLGQGLVAFKQQRIEAGLEEMLTATLLEPKVSLYQSYLGKAYYQVQRFREGLAALESAKRLDPRDPTPWLYTSLFLRDQNRQVAALDALRESIARNGNRAVYRSRLLLDRDEATRSVSLALLYRQLGFESWGAYEATKSLDADLTNASAHLFLAETYGGLPDRTQALSSALLQYFLYAPVNRNTFNTFSEYTALLDQPLRQFSIIPGIGTDGFSTGAAVSRSGNDRFAHYAFIQHDREDGGRPDEDDVRTTGFVQAKVSLTERDSIFGSYTDVTRDVGEGPEATRIFGSGTLTPIVLRQFGVPLDPNRTSKIDTQEGVLGYQHLWRPGSALTAAVQIERTVSRDLDPDQTFSACTDIFLNPDARSSQDIRFPLDRRTFQVQQATRAGRHQLIGGALLFTQDKERRCNEELYLPGTDIRVSADSIFRQRDHLYRGYVRDEIEITPWLHATIGVTYDDVRFGSMTDAARVDTLSKLSPQGGVTVRVASGTLVRAAAFRSVAGDIFGSKIAPVTVAGFVLERNEFPTTVRDEVNVSIEQSWSRAFAMGRWFLRDARVPALEDDFLISPNADTRTHGGSVFYNRILSRRFGAFVDDQYLRETTRLYVREDNVARAGISFVHERGVFAKLSAGYYSQRFVDAVVAALPKSGHLLVDADVNVEFAKKRGLLTFRVTNLFDRGFTSVLEGLSVTRLFPDRRASATLRWRF